MQNVWKKTVKRWYKKSVPLCNLSSECESVPSTALCNTTYHTFTFTILFVHTSFCYKKRLFNLFISNITIDYMFLWKITKVTSDNVDSLIWDNKLTRGLWKCCVMLCNVVVIRIFNEKKKKVKSWIVNILTTFTSLKTRLYREVES